MIGRLCEFVKIDEKGDFIGAFKWSKTWATACRREAVKIWHFANHNSFLCQEHYDRLVLWIKEDENTHSS